MCIPVQHHNDGQSPVAPPRAGVEAMAQAPIVEGGQEVDYADKLLHISLDRVVYDWYYRCTDAPQCHYHIYVH